MMPMSKLLTPREVAAILDISYESALAFIKYSGIPYTQIGRQYRVTEKQLQDFLDHKGQKVVDLTGVSEFLSIYYSM